jgi:hypothetical protein
MKSFSTTLVVLAAAISVSGFFLAGAGAEETSHDGHHPPGPAVQEPQAANPGPPAKADGSMGKMGGGMMDGDHMPKMMKMMQDMHGKMMGDGMWMMPKGDSGPSSLAFNGTMMKMHQNMDLTYTGNADVDFIKGMIPHHQGAVDMAKIELAFGKDPEVKGLAEGVIKAQEAEIAWMQDWLKKQGQ